MALKESIDRINEAIKKSDEIAKKLTTKQRKKLKSNVFCGPNRSFPVNDCAHYTAALRLLGRYKGPGDKSKIRSCIERRGKKLGCSGAKKEKSADIEALINSEIFKTTREIVEKGLDLNNCEECE